MKIAITSNGQNLDSETSQVFGRCPYFIIAEADDGDVSSSSAINNQAQNQRGGAGMAAAQTVGDQGVEAVITGSVGPNAFRVLQQLGIDVYKAEQASVEKNIDLFNEGQLEEVSSATGGSGMGRGGGHGAGRGQGRR